MRKIYLSVVLVTVLFATKTEAQTGLNLGGGVAIPIGNASEVSSVGFMIDANYLFEVAPSFQVGLATGFTTVFGKEEKLVFGSIDHDDFQYVPIALAGRYVFVNNLVFGVDMGYAVAVSDNWDGGFYYRPMFGYNLSSKVQVNTSFAGISDSWITWTTWNIGVTFNL